MTKAFAYCFSFFLVVIGEIGSSLAQQIGVTPIKIEQELPSLTVNKTFQDSAGYIWFATAYGLSRFDAFNLLTFKLRDDDGTVAPHQNILTINESNGYLLLGAENGLYTLEKETYRIVPFPDSSLRGQRVAAILVDKQSRIWVGSHSAIYVYNKDFSLHTTFEHDPSNKNSIPPGSINTIFQDQNEDIWVSIWDGGLYKLDNKKQQFVAFPPIGIRNNPFKII